jgi:lipid II:glycine glycyltransferase (peptidoglycan interpeptide bridge formation enzyme)
MTSRDEYVKNLKQQLDEWNAEISKWEAKTRSAQSDMKASYEKQLEALHARQEEARYQLHQVQVASSEAWMDVMKGADGAWKALGEAFTRARSHFEKQ